MTNGGPAKLGALDAPATERGDAQGAPSSGHVAPVVALGFFGVMKAIRKSRSLTSTERLVLLLIAGNVDTRTGTAAIGVPHLAEDSGYTERTIERTIVALLAPREDFGGAAWLWKAAELSEWNTNVYRVTPIAADVRPPRERKPRPPTQCRGTSGDPRHSVGGEQVPPDPGSSPPPIQDRAPPRSSIGHSPSSSPGSSADPEREESPHPSDRGVSENEEIMRLLCALPELQQIARPEVAKTIADERRPLAIVGAALAELAADARTGAAVGQAFGARELAKKARTYVRDCRAPAAPSGAAAMPADDPAEPVEPPRLREHLGELLVLGASVGAEPPKPTTKAPDAWKPPVTRKRT